MVTRAGELRSGESRYDESNEVFKRRALILLGKGGVGKTSVSAALAMAAAHRGERVLLMETDSHAPIAALFGCDPGLAPVEVEAAANLYVMVLDGRRSLEEYLRTVVPGRAILNAVFASRLYQYFVQAAPGLRELMALGKFCYEVGQKPDGSTGWARVILDAPASGQAINLLKMPTVARETFGESIVGREAQNITTMLRDGALCSVILVTTPDLLSLAETLETHQALAATGLKIAAVILNRSNPATFDSGDLARFADNPKLSSLKTLNHICELARAELDRAAQSRRALAQLKERIQSPVIELGEHRGMSGLELIKALAAELGDQGESSRADRAEARP
ncbi:MAG: ArsA family ATPase [Candidatus Binatales bacterium]